MVEDTLFAVELELLDVFAQLYDDRQVVVVHTRDDAVHMQRLASIALERQVLAQVGVFVGQRLLAQAHQFIGVLEQLRQGLARQGLERTLQQVLGRRVGVADPAFVVQHQHSRSEQIEAGQRARLAGGGIHLMSDNSRFSASMFFSERAMASRIWPTRSAYLLPVFSVGKRSGSPPW